MTLPSDERLLQLLADRATQGLPPGQALELEGLLGASAALDLAEPEALELAAAELALALELEALGLDEDAPAWPELPAGLHEKLLAQAPPLQQTPPLVQAPQPTRQTPAPLPRPTPSAWWPALLACAACLAVFWLTLAELSPLGAPPQRRSDPAALRAEVLREPGALQVAWSPPTDPRYARVEGDVVWSDATQRGVMRLRDLPPNDPAQGQYQLWIVDPSRDSKPVDGGVFDVTRPGEVLIPIDAKLRVRGPQAFALTFEQPGGVVVSAGPLLVVAAP